MVGDDAPERHSAPVDSQEALVLQAWPTLSQLEFGFAELELELPTITSHIPPGEPSL